jgi:nucleoside phosphorylase
MLLIVAATEPELRGAAGIPGVETLACGVGPIDAAATVAARLAREPRPTALLHVGIAGARRARALTPGTLVVGTGALYCDSTSHLVTRSALPDDDLLASVHAVVPDAPLLVIGTSGDVDGTDACDVEAMEGFAVLRAAALAGVPAIEVRAISNDVEEPDRALWRFDDALDAVASALPLLAAAIASPQHVG